MVTILMMPANISTLDLLEIKIFWEKDYGATTFVYGVTNKFLHVAQIILQMWSCDHSLVFLWEKLHQFYKNLTRKPTFFEGWSWFQFNNWDWHYGFVILHQCGKIIQTKSHKVFGANFYVCRSCRGKVGRGAFLPPTPPILNRV